MKIETSQVRMLDITDAPRLDRIKVITEDFAPGKGQLTVICWGRAWTAYWGGMAEADVSRFVVSMDPEYIAENLMYGMQAGLVRERRRETQYLVRIVKAVREALRRVIRQELHGVPLSEPSHDWEGA